MSSVRQLEAGIRFLLRNQDRDGAWRDFRLAPGRSGAWTTAFIGLRLLACARGKLRSPVRNALLEAARFLDVAREPHGGWAYNRRCPADADSTACAILFLRESGAPVQPKDYAALARFQLPEGGFATYRFAGPGHSWCRAHPEVTATALRALAPMLPPDHIRIRQGLDWLTDRAGRDGSSYWWRSPHYLAIEAEHLRRAFPSSPRFDDPDCEPGADSFDLALMLELGTLRRSASSIRELAALLLDSQQEDGGWPSSRILRIPDPRRPDAGSAIASDDRRLATTAAAVSALRAARAWRHASRREWRPAEALSPPA